MKRSSPAKAATKSSVALWRRAAACRLAEGHSGKLEPGDPALGARQQGGDRFRRQAQAHRPVEEGAALLDVEAEGVLTDLGDLVARTQAGQRQRRILARADDQVEAGRLIRQEERNQLMHREVANRVIVIHDQH